MFDFDAGKLIIVGVIALIFIPTKDLPRVLRQVGQFVGKMRRLASEFQGQFMDAMREADMADMRREAQKLSDAARISTGLDAMHGLDVQGLDRDMASSLSAPHASAQPSQPAPAERTLSALAASALTPSAQQPEPPPAEVKAVQPALDRTHSEA